MASAPSYRLLLWPAIGIAAALSAASARAQPSPPGPPANVRFEQKLGAQLPAGAKFRDESDREISLHDYLGPRPLVLALVYYECPMLCTEVLNGLVRALKGVPLRPGEAFDVAALSFDPAESPELAARKKAAYLERYGDAGSAAGWHFLTGEESQIKRVTEAVGFRYRYDPRTGQFAHPAGILVISPDGRVSRYLYGVDYAPRDLKLALVEAAEGRIGSPVDQLLLLCYQYDPASGRYGLMIQRVLRASGVLTVLGLGALVYVVSRGKRQKAFRT